MRVELGPRELVRAPRDSRSRLRHALLGATLSFGALACQTEPPKTATAIADSPACVLYHRLGKPSESEDRTTLAELVRDMHSSVMSIAYFEQITGEEGTLSGKGAKEVNALREALRAERKSVDEALSRIHAESPDIAKSEFVLGEAMSALRTYCAAPKAPKVCATIPSTEATLGEVVAFAKVQGAGKDRDIAQRSQAVETAFLEYEKLGGSLRAKMMAAHDELATLSKKLDETFREAGKVCGDFSEDRVPFMNVEWSVAAAAKPRELTFVVVTKPAAATAKEFIDAAAMEEKSGHAELARVYRGAAEGGFGTGFLLVRPEGATLHGYLVTNRHVVEPGPNIEVHAGSSSKTTYAAKLLYEDDDADLAILSLDGSPPMKAGFGVAPHALKDGEPISVAGYPGIGDDPVYQLSKGYVSNESFELNGARFVQHTAPTDPGGSGGPVLDKEGKVAAVSAAKAKDREATSIAVPRDELIRVIDMAMLVERFGNTEDLRKRALLDACLDLVHRASTAEALPTTMISRKLVEEQGIANVQKLVAELPPPQAEIVKEAWRTSPAEATRFATLIRLRGALESVAAHEVCSAVYRETDLLAKDVVHVPLLTFSGSKTVDFIYEAGRYRVRRF